MFFLINSLIICAILNVVSSIDLFLDIIITEPWQSPFIITGEYKLFRKSIKVEFLKPLKIGEDLEKENTKLMKLVSKKLIEGGKISGSKR